MRGVVILLSIWLADTGLYNMAGLNDLENAAPSQRHEQSLSEGITLRQETDDSSQKNYEHANVMRLRLLTMRVWFSWNIIEISLSMTPF